MAKITPPNYFNYQLPGIKKVAFKRKFVPDLIFFLSVVALPSSFFNFIDKNVFIDLRLLFLVVGVLYLIFNIKYIKKISKIKGGKFLIIFISYILFKIIHSIVFQNIYWLEVLTVFRTNFFFPIVTLGFLCYAAKMDNKRLYRFFYWLLLVTFFQGILYIIANLSGFNFYANTSKEFQEFQEITIIQNLQSLPDYNIVLFAFALLTALIVPQYKKHWFWITPLIVTVLSIVRNQMIVYVLILLALYAFGMFSNLKIRVSKIVKAFFVLAICLLMTLLVFPSHIGRVINKFGFDKSEQISASTYTEEGTFKVRLDLIENAYNRTEHNNSLILGNGYIREATKGEYDFVVGGDTLIAPVIFTEGLLGLLMRCFPIFSFLFFGFKNLRNKNKHIALFSLLIVALILPEILNAVQTKIFVYYHHVMFIIYLLMMILYNEKQIHKKIFKTYNP